MESRLKYWTVAPEAVKRMAHLNSYLQEASIETGLRHLVLLRVSQINGCAYCVDLHSHEALRDGEKAQRLHLLVVWRETDLFSPREKAALAYAESVTLVAETHVPDADYQEAARHFNEHELVDLTLLIATMNAWNRMAISFRRPPGVRRSEPAA
ncbi:MAG TPA: carboxymuconolactone decarboxylase family protein [Xanthobacteraceae bacterium]|nr:carboxymuconolactone decarboxylase family protein [Xanthobacteraceae bacterium]